MEQKTTFRERVFNDGYEYGLNYVRKTFRGYREAKRWAKLSSYKEDAYKLAKEELEEYGIPLDFVADNIPWWWAKSNDKLKSLTIFYKGKFKFCQDLLNGNLEIDFIGDI